MALASGVFDPNDFSGLVTRRKLESLLQRGLSKIIPSTIKAYSNTSHKSEIADYKGVYPYHNGIFFIGYQTRITHDDLSIKLNGEIGDFVYPISKI